MSICKKNQIHIFLYDKSDAQSRTVVTTHNDTRRNMALSEIFQNNPTHHEFLLSSDNCTLEQCLQAYIDAYQTN